VHLKKPGNEFFGLFMIRKCHLLGLGACASRRGIHTLCREAVRLEYPLGCDPHTLLPHICAYMYKKLLMISAETHVHTKLNSYQTSPSSMEAIMSLGRPIFQ
jgi:hypothetical protein